MLNLATEIMPISTQMVLDSSALCDEQAIKLC